jgi:phosphopantothenoylcysteine decarboxylase/phosphopantothenate--cysteine ligase
VSDLSKLVGGIKGDYCAVPAAISDFRPKKTKGKASSKERSLTVELTRAPKIVNAIRKKSKRIRVIGFKLESGLSEAELEAKALEKLKSAGLHLIVANDVKTIGEDTAKVILLDRSGKSEVISGTKATLAHHIWSAAVNGL